jgi:hypothetical protein
MLDATQQHAVDQFAKSLLALGDDALIDTYHQAWEDHRDARGEGSDNLSKACAKSRATEKAMRDRFPDYQSRYKQRYPLNQLVLYSRAPILPALAAVTGERAGIRFL